MSKTNTPDISNLTIEQKRALLTKLMQRKNQQKVRSNTVAPLSFAQQRLWFIAQLQPEEIVYTIPAALRLQGELKVDVLQQALNEIVARHEILRTQFVTIENGPSQKILSQIEIEVPVIEMPVIELTLTESPAIEASPQNNLSDDIESSIRPYLQTLVAQPFDLETGPLIRCQLLKLNATDHILAVTVHHIVADYWSLKLLMKEIALLYSAFSLNQASPLPALPIQYGDYAAWQHTQQAEFQDQLDYWLQQLPTPPTLLQLPTDFPRPAVQSFNGARYHFTLSPELSEELSQLAQQSQATLFMTLIAAFQVLLYRYSGQSDILVGSTVSNRDRAEAKDLIGLFVNNLVFRAEVTPNQSFTHFLQQVKTTALSAYSHKEVPFEQVVDALQIERQLSHNALFQVMFILHNTPTANFALPELTVTALKLDNSAARFDLSLDMYENEAGLTGIFEYNTDLFKPSTIERLVTHFERLLAGIVANPESSLGLLPLLTDAELTDLQAWNKTTVSIPQQCAHQLIEKQVVRTPNAIALSLNHTPPEQPWTYQQLNQRANQLAHYLLSQGTQPGSRIALAINRSAELVIAILAVLKLGGTYIPIDPTHPAKRLQHVLENSEATLILESDASLTGLTPEIDFHIVDIKIHTEDIERQSTDNPAISVSPEDLAYIIYTSGSTGKPKGVPIQHRSLVNLLTSMSKAPGISAEDTFLAVTTIAFDIATLELLLPLTVGAQLVIASTETVRDSDRLIVQLASDNITLMQATPATWRLLIDAGWKGVPALKILCGGEALDLPLAQQLLPCGHELWNLYGPTETTIWSSALRITEEQLSEGFVPIGGPITNTEFHVLDKQQQPVPMSIPGELHIGGMGLSPGYWNRKDLTAERFANVDSRLYRTGDLVRRHPNGTLEYLGRLDHQIKLRGFRIELGEIEAALNDHPDIEQSLVTLRPQANNEPQLVAYCKVWADVDWLKAQPIRQSISKQLPTYMLPTAYVLLADFPLTPNGKIDRKALPEPQPNTSTTDSLPPQTPTEQLLANIWAETLNLSTVSTTDNFFEIGGHSLLAARIVARVKPIFGVSVSLRSLFENPILSDFATTLEIALQGTDQTFQPIQSIERINPLPLSYAQKRQWVLAQLEPDNPFYNIPAALKVVGDFSLPTLQESLAILCQRHEGLRSAFKSGKGEAQLDILQTVTPNISYVDAREDSLTDQQIEQALTTEARVPFDLEQAPLMRVKVMRIEAQTYIISLVLHHILADAESIGLLMKEIVHVYSQLQANASVSLPSLAVQYVDYAAWQQQIDTSQQLSYWQNQLADAPPLIALPTDYPRPVTQQFEGGSHRFSLTPKQTVALKQFSQRHSATVFMTLMAAFQSLLHRYSGAEDLVVGTPISHRPQTALEGVLGMFVNTLALRGDFSKEISFIELLQQTRTTALAAYAHQDVPFEQVIDALNVPRSWSHSPLFQAMFVWQAAKPTSVQAVENLTWTPITLESNTTKVDITLSMAEETTAAGEIISGKLEYRQDLFKAGTIEAMADAFCTLLDSVVASPEQFISELSLVSEKQMQQLQKWNDTAREYLTELCLHQLFEQQVARSPQASALITPTETLSYQALNTKANQLAHQLRTLGITPESRVGICLDRTVNLVIAILATLKAGGAYVPLDPNYPPSRLAYTLEDAQTSVVITQSAYKGIVASAPHLVVLDSPIANESIANEQTEQTEQEVQPNNLAYIIYTSGSTGKPKGVAIEHRSPVALVQWASEVFSPAQLSGVLASTSVCFDLSVFEIFVPLSNGGSIILAENVLQLPTLPAAEKVTLINTVPTAIAELARINGIPHSVTTINLAGEPIPAPLIQQLYNLDSVQQVFNLYGPSEDTTYSTYTLLSPNSATVPIGNPIANTQAYVLDQQQNSVPIGMPGELYLAGDGLARGYWNRSEMTADRFTAGLRLRSALGSDNQRGLSGAEVRTQPVLYRTGDRVRQRPDGQLEFLGRIDNQVKVRGFRIELGEIESSLLQHSQVIQAAVNTWTDSQNNQRLVAYVVFIGASEKESLGKALSPLSAAYTGLKSHLQKTLPDYMLPTAIVPLAALPLLPNGKINRKALPEPIFDQVTKVAESPLTDTEQTLVTIWQTLLGQSVGIHDNFFELGGDSILAIQAISQAQTSGLYFSPRDLFQYSTISQLAAIAKTQATNQVQQTPIVGEVPLTPIQHWFFDQNLTDPHHWNQSVLLTVKQALKPEILTQALQQLMHHHDALRAVFHLTKTGWIQSYQAPSDAVPLKVVQASVDNATSMITAEAKAAQSGFSLQDGPLWKVIYYDLKTATGPERRLLIVSHHLLVDGVSWRILLNDLQMLYQQLSQSSMKAAQLPPKTLSCQYWANQLLKRDFSAELLYWKTIDKAELPSFPQDYSEGTNIMATSETVSVSLSERETTRLLKEVTSVYSARIEDILLTGLILALEPWTGTSLRIELEGHGRPEDQDFSRTVGWLTTLYPVLFNIPTTTDIDAAIKSVKETLRAVPNKGLGYGALRYLKSSSEKTEATKADTPIRFNYLGQTDQLFAENDWFAPAAEQTGAARSPQDNRDVLLEINAVVSRGKLTVHWSYSHQRHKLETVECWANNYLSQISSLIEHCLSADTNRGYTPTDFPQMGLDQGELDDLLANIGGES